MSPVLSRHASEQSAGLVLIKMVQEEGARQEIVTVRQPVAQDIVDEKAHVSPNSGGG